MIATATPVNETKLDIAKGKEVKAVDALNYVLELEGEICSLDRTFTANLRNTVYRLKLRTKKDIYTLKCYCGAVSRKHNKYVYDWAS
tara:strand:- start:3893 stop:4153 length:261 start_codon:yes stop_codon:yes gene_type:complete